jgi:hypothetical protein
MRRSTRRLAGNGDGDEEERCPTSKSLGERGDHGIENNASVSKWIDWWCVLTDRD